MASSCVIPKYLPSSDEFNTTVRGSHVKGLQIHPQFEYRKIDGELIAVENDTFYVLDRRFKQVRVHYKSDLKTLRVFLTSRAKDLSGGANTMNVLNAVLPIGHGWWMVFTYPINWIVTASILQSKYVMRLNEEFSWPSLYKFARFPQGIPEGVDLKDLNEVDLSYSQ